MRHGSTRRYDNQHQEAAPRAASKSSSSRRKRRRRGPSFGLILMLIASIVVGGSIGLLLRRESPRVIVDRWRQQLEVMPEDEVPAALDRAIANDSVGLPLLAAALASNRTAVVSQAEQLLHEKIEQIKTLPPAQAAPELDRLASTLSEHVQQFGPSATASVKAIAQQLLQWPVEGNEQSRIDLVAHCERILRGGDADSDIQRKRIPTASIGATLPSQSTPTNDYPHVASRTFDSTPMDSSVARYTNTPGGNLPYETLPMPSVPPVLHAGPENGQGPRTLSEPNNAQPLQPNDTPQRLPIQAPTAPALIPTPTLGSASFHQTQSQPSNAAVARSAQVATAASPVDLASATTLQLVQALPRVSAAELPALEQELLRRGFTSADFQLVARFNSPRAEDRRALAPLIVQSPTPWALQWLLWLSHDPSPAVRYEAISMLATAHDPAIVQRMQEAVQQEPQPEIVRLAENYLQRGQR